MVQIGFAKLPLLHEIDSVIILQGGSKKVSCWHSTTAYFFWATLYIQCLLRVL